MIAHATNAYPKKFEHLNYSLTLLAVKGIGRDLIYKSYRFESRSGHFPGFPPNFDEFRQHMDQTFDELFKIFGNDSMPMFDPFRPPTSGKHADTRTYSTIVMINVALF